MTTPTDKNKDAAPLNTATSMTTTINMIVPNRLIKMFNSTNYSMWATGMKNVLTEHDINKYLNKKETITNYNDREDHQALFEIQFALADNQMKKVINCRMAHDAWEKLKSIYMNADKSNIMFLKSQFI